MDPEDDASDTAHNSTSNNNSTTNNQSTNTNSNANGQFFYFSSSNGQPFQMNINGQSVSPNNINGIGPMLNNVMGSVFNQQGINMMMQQGQNIAFQMMQSNGFGNIIQQAMQSGNGPPPTSQNTIASLPEYKYQASEENEEQKQNDDGKVKECAICKEKFEKGDVLIELPCHHRYHKDCIMPWLTQRNSCPTCRHRLPTDNQFYEQMENMRSNNNGNGPPPLFNILGNMFGAPPPPQQNNGNSDSNSN